MYRHLNHFTCLRENGQVLVEFRVIVQNWGKIIKQEDVAADLPQMSAERPEVGMKCRWIMTIFVLQILMGMLVPTSSPAGKNVTPPAASKVTLYYFWGEGCPHCAKATPFLQELGKKYPQIDIRYYEVFSNEENMKLLVGMDRAAGADVSGVPTFFIDGKMLSGFSPETAKTIEERIRTHFVDGRKTSREQSSPSSEEDVSVSVPLLGKISSSTLSLPVFTVVIAGLDSFNPCAFFVLFFLLSLLVHAHSRVRMVLIGGTFVLFSGLIYFIFMTAWLNLFLLTRSLKTITIAAALIALVVAALNIKDFFYFKKGASLTIPETAQPKLFERMRRLLGAASLPAMLAGTVFLAIAANSYELLCTAGFPMIFTRVLTLNQLSMTGYYIYLAFYNTVYIIPLAVIVTFFTVTLGSKKLSEWQGRVLKLVSGLMMLGLGFVLLIKPTLLSSALISTGLLAITLLAAFIIIRLTRKYAPHQVKADS